MKAIMRMTRLRGKADLGKGPVLGTLIKLSIPSIAMVLFHTLFHLVDTVFISWLGESHMVAISYTFPVQIGGFEHYSRLAKRRTVPETIILPSFIMPTSLQRPASSFKLWEFLSTGKEKGG